MVGLVSSFAIVNDSFARLCKAGNCGLWECRNKNEEEGVV